MRAAAAILLGLLIPVPALAHDLPFFHSMQTQLALDGAVAPTGALAAVRASGGAVVGPIGVALGVAYDYAPRIEVDEPVDAVVATVAFRLSLVPILFDRTSARVLRWVDAFGDAGAGGGLAFDLGDVRPRGVAYVGGGIELRLGIDEEAVWLPTLRVGVQRRYGGTPRSIADETVLVVGFCLTRIDD